MVDRTLQEGIQAVKGGNFDRARRLFNQVLEEDPDSEQGWYWLGLIAPDEDKRIACFLRALDINPSNREVREKLQRLGVPVPDEPDQPLVGSNGLPLDQEETGPLPQAPGTDSRQSRPIPEVFQPLEEEEEEPGHAEEKDVHPVSADNSVLVPAQAYEDENLDETYGQDLELGPGQVKGTSLESRLLPLLVILLVVACASVIYLSARSGGLSFGLAFARPSATPTVTPTLRPPTPTASHTPQPSATATPVPPTSTATPTLSPLDSLARLNPLLEQAAGLAQTRQYSAAIQTWDEALTLAPEQAELYFKRGQSYLAQVSQVQQIPDNAQELLQSAQDDLTEAILLGPLRGAYFQTRYEILDWIARLEIMRDRRVPALEQMLADVSSLEAYHLAMPLGDPNPAKVLSRLGRCQEAMDYVDQQVSARPEAVPPAELYTELARIYLCYGQPRGAILYANMAVSTQTTPEREWVRAIALYNLGRSNETLNLLDDLLESNPEAPGDRYYLRALVHFQRREYELAQADLDRGQQRTPDRAQLAAYAAGLLAQRAGDQASADEQFTLAEESLSLEYGLVLDRVRRELEIPPPERGIPVLPDAVIRYLDEAPETIQAPVQLSEPDDLLLPARYDGSGAFHLTAEEQLGLHLMPPVPVNILFVDSLTLRLASAAPIQAGDVEAFLWDFSLGSWEPTDLAGGENPVSDPSRFVNPLGDIYLRLTNRSGSLLAVDNLNLTLAIAAQQPNSQP